MRWGWYLFGLLVAVVVVAYVASAPQNTVDKIGPQLVGETVVDLANGETLFWAGGCASCHAAAGAAGDEKLLLGGGLALDTPFGLFRVPNISPDLEHGIGGWTSIDFVRAMRDGVSPQDKHYYPAFPYEYYQHMTVRDLLDLQAFLATLPAVSAPAPASEIDFPYNVRRGIGLWKRLYLQGQPLSGAGSVTLQRGEYLVRGPGHCGFCHTPRNRFGGLVAGRMLAGAAALELSEDGSPSGRIPNITPHAEGLADWAADDIAYALETGFDPDYDSFGGTMVQVQENMARLSGDDRAAISAYLKTVPALPSE